MTRDYLSVRFGDRHPEVFAVLFLDNRHRLIECVELFAARLMAPMCIHGKWQRKRQHGMRR